MSEVKRYDTDDIDRARQWAYNQQVQRDWRRKRWQLSGDGTHPGVILADTVARLEAELDRQSTCINGLLSDITCLKANLDIWQGDYYDLQAERDRLRDALNLIDAELASGTSITTIRWMIHQALAEEEKQR